MRPIYRVLADRVDITSALADRLLSLTVTDAAGVESDTAEVRMDDRAPGIALPRTGAELEIQLGYGSTGLTSMGLYTVDEIELAGPPSTMTIRAKGADMRKALKAQRTRSWHETTVGDVVASIAGQHGLTPAVAADLASVPILHLDQTAESDLHLLTRLAGQHDAVSKPVAGRLVFVPRGQAKSATGRALPPVTMARADLTDWRVTLAERGLYGSIEAEWHDAATGDRRKVTAGDGEPVRRLGRTFPTEAEAASAARAALAEAERGRAKLSLSCPGRVDLAAEGRLILAGVRTGVDGDWSITTVTQSVDSGGWRTSVEAETVRA